MVCIFVYCTLSHSISCENMVSSGPYSAPTNFEVIAYSSAALFLTWDNPPATDLNGVIRKYNVRILEVETGKTLQLTSNKTSIRVTDLHPYYLYNCSVAAYTVADGPYTEHEAARTLEDSMYFYTMFLHNKSLNLSCRSKWVSRESHCCDRFFCQCQSILEPSSPR